VHVADGDTFSLETPTGEQIWIRLAEIDAPEGDQPFGDRAKRHLEDLIEGKTVRVVVKDTDDYGRTVGRPFTAARDVCADMVADGAAWAYRRYLVDTSLLELEASARLNQRGLWGATDPIPPWDWRHREPAGVPHSVPAVADATCAIKGNISAAGERIYHVPGQRYYAITRIDTGKGERWFCSESAAREAGWRRSKM
jgi:hypothetical protein